MHTLPKRLGKLPESFLQQRCSEDTLKAFACEVLALLPVLLAFMRNVVAPSGALPQHCKCFELLCRIVGILQQGDVACRKAPVLADLVHAHAALYAELYKDLVRPKCHYLLHLASQLQHLQVNVRCFVTERKHREVKRLAATTFSHFEASLCANHLNEQIEKLTDPTNHIYHPVRLEAAPRTHTHTHAHTQRTRTPAHTHTRTHTHTHPHTDTDEHTRTHKHTHTHIYIYIHTRNHRRSAARKGHHHHIIVTTTVSSLTLSAARKRLHHHCHRHRHGHHQRPEKVFIIVFIVIVIVIVSSQKRSSSFIPTSAFTHNLLLVGHLFPCCCCRFTIATPIITLGSILIEIVTVIDIVIAITILMMRAVMMNKMKK